MQKSKKLSKEYQTPLLKLRWVKKSETQVQKNVAAK